MKFAFMASIIVYGIVVSGMHLEGEPQDAHTMTMLLAAVYVVILLVSPLIERLQKPGLPAFVIRLACRETGAIFGLVLAMISHDPKYVLYFGVPAFLLLAIA